MNGTAAELLGFHVRRRTRSLLLVLFAVCYESKKGTCTSSMNPPFQRRGDKTAIELFIAGIRGWEAYPRRRLDDGKPVGQVT
jgi:hypothetical protein